tara:strand:+ start:10947 stop:12722 length:1776 start_codon:yes stop_codon:yes gene_type:complete
MANGIAALPFPTFGGGKGQPSGITPVQMSPAQIRFPTARGGGGSETNPLAGLAPFALDYGIDFLFDKYGGPDTKATLAPSAPPPDYLDIEDYLDDEGGFTRDQLRAELTDPERVEFLADQIFGPKVIPPKSKIKRNLKRGASFLAGLQFDDPREQTAFVKSYAALNTGTVPDDARRKWIGEYMKSRAGEKLDVQTAYLDDGSGQNRSVVESPSGGLYIMSKGEAVDTDVEGNAIPIGKYYQHPQWVAGQGPVDPTKIRNTTKASSEAFETERNKYEEIANSLTAVVPLMNTLLANKLENPEFDTLAGAPIRLAGEIKALVNVVNSKVKPEARLKESADGTLTWFNPADGTASGKFTDMGTNEFIFYENEYDADGIERRRKKTLNLESTFGNLANSADSRSALIQLAYLAAAANGQTGRTLSDKDLALHLQILGANFKDTGGLADPKGSIRGLTGWLSRQLLSTDIKMKTLESGSIASDYRKAHRDNTPWAPKWIAGTDKETGVHRIKPIAATWLNRNDAEWQKLVQLYYAAQKKYGSDVIPDNPLPGVSWNEQLKTIGTIYGDLGPEPTESTVPGPRIPSGGRLRNRSTNP